MTIIMYLNDIPEKYGAATGFPNLNLQFQPKKNAIIFFYNLQKRGYAKTDIYTPGDKRTLHSGNPLLSNRIEKWAVNSWIRVNKYEYKKVAL